MVPHRSPCAVCGGPSFCAHYGVVSCRACAAFFRRAAKNSANFHCNNNASCYFEGNNDTAKMCKHCRLERCLRAGMQENTPRNKSPESGSCSVRYWAFSEELLKQSESTSDDFPLLRWFYDNYQILTRERRAADRSILPMVDCPLDELFPTHSDVVRRVPFDKMERLIGVNVPMIVAFAEAMAPEASFLPPDERKEFLREFCSFFTWWDNGSRTARIFGSDTPKKMASVTAYIDPDYRDSEFDAMDGMTKSIFEMMKYNSTSARRALVRGSFVRLDMDEFEIAAFLAHKLWSIGVEGFPTSVEEKRLRCKDTIMRELHRYYRNTKHIENYAGRVGEIVNLALWVEAEAREKQEEWALFVAFEVRGAKALDFFGN